MKVACYYFFIFLLCSNTSIGQKLEDVNNYYTGFNADTFRETFNVAGLKFAYDSNHVIFFNDIITYRYPKDSSGNFEIYKRRYLFVSFYERTPNMPATASWIRRKYRVKVFDLKNPKKQWEFYFAGYNSSGFRSFKPKKSKVKLLKRDIIYGH